MLKTIYLAGEMNDKSKNRNKMKPDIQAKWREEIISLIHNNIDLTNDKIIFNSPDEVGCDHNGIDPELTVESDLNLIEESDIIITYLNRKELYGTIVETIHAAFLKKQIFIIDNIKLIDEMSNKYNEYTQTNHSCYCQFYGTAFNMSPYWFLKNYLKQIHNKNVIFCEKDNKMTEIIDYLISIGYPPSKLLKEKNEEYLNTLISDNPQYEKSIIIQKFKRNLSLIHSLKEKIKQCQICGFTFKKKDGENYNEIHHIIPLSENGKDEEINTLIVCANCHSQLHFANTDISKIKQGIIKINGEEKVIKNQ